MKHDKRDRDDADVATPDSSAHSATYEWRERDRPSAVIVEAVATATGRDPAEVTPLDDCIDPDAVDAVFASVDHEAGAGVSLSFQIDDVTVVVDGDGTLEIGPTGTANDRRAWGPESEEELNERVGRLVNAAFENGIDVRGGWSIENETGPFDWEAHVTKIARGGAERSPTTGSDEEPAE